MKIRITPAVCNSNFNLSICIFNSDKIEGFQTKNIFEREFLKKKYLRCSNWDRNKKKQKIRQFFIKYYKNSIIVVGGIRTADLKLETPHKYNIREALIE